MAKKELVAALDVTLRFFDPSRTIQGMTYWWAAWGVVVVGHLATYLIVRLAASAVGVAVLICGFLVQQAWNREP